MRRKSFPTRVAAYFFSGHLPGGRLVCLVVIFLVLPLKISRACSPIDRSFHGYTFVDVNILGQGNDSNLLWMPFDQLYEHYFKAVDAANRNDNLAEWSQRFCGEVKTEDLAYVIYSAPAGDLEELGKATRSKSFPVPLRLQGNTFAEYVWEHKCTETIDYLVFAKKCEPHVVHNDRWQALPRNVETMQALISQGKEEFKKTKSHYIRLRYAYQIVRLAHYAGQHQQALDLYEELVPQIDKKASRWNESILPWWILGHKAGALMRLGNNVEASYYFALVYQHCPGKRAPAYQSFSIRTDEEWQACLRLCNSDAERATLYIIRASTPRSKALGDMEKIYQLDPTNESLETLLVQELRKLERSLVGLQFNPRRAENKRYHNLPRPDAKDYALQLLKFVRQCRQQQQVVRPALWHLAEGYLEFMTSSFEAAIKTFDQVANSTKDKALLAQLEVFRLALEIAYLPEPNEQTEKVVYQILEKNKVYRSQPSFTTYLRDRMASLYAEYGQKGKAFLCQNRLSDLKPNPDMGILDDLIALLSKPERTAFEKLLAEGISVNDLLDIKATNLLSQGLTEAAYDVFRRIPTEAWDNYGQFDPFRETFKDCLRCKMQADTLPSLLNKGELIETLLDLEIKAKSNAEGAARHFYNLGLAWYNMSYFGYEWPAMDYFRSGSTWERLHKGQDGVYDYWKYPLGNRENTDVSKAYYFFEKARLLAKDPELAARAAFQAARCEQKIFFKSSEYKPEPCCNRIPRLPQERLENFKRLKEQYSQTNFYQQIIGECKYFQVYASK